MPDQPTTMTDEEFFAARRDAMGEKYPGDEAMRQQDRDDAAATRTWVEQQQAQAAPAAASGDWDARAWLRDTFRDDPNFNQLGAADLARLEALATEKHDALGNDATAWASATAGDYNQLFRERIEEAAEASPAIQQALSAQVHDGVADPDGLIHTLETLPPAEAVEAVRPVAEAAHELDGEVLNGAQLIVEQASGGAREVIEARIDMPGGDTAQMHGLLETVDAVPDRVGEVMDFARADQDHAWHKAEDRMDAIQAGADPRSLHDPDTWQADPAAAEHAQAEA